jgi:phenylpropionate dioxygenase-like ring-hydroxylating dioxygenase large terminal subunit
LLHAPHADAFAGLDPSARGLVEVPLVERHGLLWVIPAKGARLDEAALADHLRELDGDLAACALDEQIVIRRAASERRCNWKLVIDAFLEGYHIRRLHRDSVARFFLDAHGAVVAFGPHVRALSARRTLVGRDADSTITRVRDLVTPSFLIFPNTVVILHPDYTSVLVMTPLAVDRVQFEHTLIVPRDRAGAALADHYAASFDLIERGVFQAEDLAACEAIQRGLEARADDALVCGGLERAVPWFHQAIDDAITRGA